MLYSHNDFQNFTIASGLKQQMLIGPIPIYGKYNKYKKVKGMRHIGKYQDQGDDTSEISQFKVGDDWGDIGVSLVHYFMEEKDLEKSEAKNEAKAFLSRIYHNELTKSDRAIIKDVIKMI